MKNLARACLLVVLAACASGPVSPTAGPIPSNGDMARTDGPDPTPLANSNIPSGRCGMILWTKNGGRIAPMFRSLDTVNATMVIEGDEVSLVLASQEGDSRFGMRARQVFTAADATVTGTIVETNITWGQSFPGGTYINSGSLKLTATDGWQRIIPVAGIAGCKA